MLLKALSRLKNTNDRHYQPFGRMDGISKPFRQGGNCPICGRPGHLMAICKYRKPRGCYWCGSTEHMLQQCTINSVTYSQKTSGWQAEDGNKPHTTKWKDDIVLSPGIIDG